MRNFLVPIAVAMVGVVAAAAVMVGCGPEADDQAQINRSVERRTETFGRAELLYPIPVTSNFPLREAVSKFTARQDLINHPWYVYIMGDNGNIIGYYVAQTVPVSTCAFLSSTENIVESEGTDLVLTAPSLDGIFYGGGGSSAECGDMFFFDYTTDALIQIGNMKYFTADQQLAVEAEPIDVK